MLNTGPGINLLNTNSVNIKKIIRIIILNIAWKIFTAGLNPCELGEIIIIVPRIEITANIIIFKNL